MIEYPSYLIHYGTLGQKWGHRRFQNEDGPNDPLGGHEITVEFDIKTGKYRTHSLNG